MYRMSKLYTPPRMLLLTFWTKGHWRGEGTTVRITHHGDYFTWPSCKYTRFDSHKSNIRKRSWPVSRRKRAKVADNRHVSLMFFVFFSDNSKRRMGLTLSVDVHLSGAIGLIRLRACRRTFIHISCVLLCCNIQPVRKSAAQLHSLVALHVCFI